MTKMDFANEVANRIGGVVMQKDLANGLKATGVTIKSGGASVQPLVYIDEMFDRGYTVDEAVKAAMDMINQNKETAFDIDWVDDWDKAKKKLVVRLYNQISEAEVCEPAAPYGFNDLIIVPYLVVSDNAYIRVTKEIMKKWSNRTSTVIKQGIANLEPKICRLSDILGFGMGDPVDDMLYIVTNKTGSFGASSILVAQESLREIFPNGYVVLPSSIHEVLVISNDLGGDNELVQMVRAVNATDVKEEEVLSDNIYKF